MILPPTPTLPVVVRVEEEILVAFITPVVIDPKLALPATVNPDENTPADATVKDPPTDKLPEVDRVEVLIVVALRVGV